MFYDTDNFDGFDLDNNKKLENDKTLENLHQEHATGFMAIPKNYVKKIYIILISKNLCYLM